MKAKSIILIVVVIGLAIFAITKFGKKNEISNDQTENNYQVESANTMDTTENTTTNEETLATKKMDNGLEISVLKEGSGAEVKNGQTASVNYTGKFADGKTFDSNVDPAFKHVEPFQFKIGAGQVIAGWDQGVLGMKVGEKRKLTIPYTLGYGEQGYGPIPAKATLIFEVELLAIK